MWKVDIKRCLSAALEPHILSKFVFVPSKSNDHDDCDSMEIPSVISITSVFDSRIVLYDLAACI